MAVSVTSAAERQPGCSCWVQDESHSSAQSSSFQPLMRNPILRNWAPVGSKQHLKGLNGREMDTAWAQMVPYRLWAKGRTTAMLMDTLFTKLNKTWTSHSCNGASRRKRNANGEKSLLVTDAGCRWTSTDSDCSPASTAECCLIKPVFVLHCFSQIVRPWIPKCKVMWYLKTNMYSPSLFALLSGTDEWSFIHRTSQAHYTTAWCNCRLGGY